MRDTLRLLLSAAARERWSAEIAQVLAGRPHVFVDPAPGIDTDVAFVSRDVTGRSTKHQLEPATEAFYAALRGAPGLRWVHTHSAGADRPIFGELAARGVRVTTSAGANAAVVAHTALAGVLALARRLPLLGQAQREHRWAPLFGADMPADLAGQHAVVVGWGAIGQELARLLQALGLHVTVARHSPGPAGGGLPTITYGDLDRVLPRMQWLLLACPLTERTRGLVGARQFALLPARAHLVNVARGEVVDESALVEVLRARRLAGAFLDVFAHEPLLPSSPLWDLPNVIVTPHSAGFSTGNEARVGRLFLEHLARYAAPNPSHKET